MPLVQHLISLMLGRIFGISAFALYEMLVLDALLREGFFTQL